MNTLYTIFSAIVINSPLPKTSDSLLENIMKLVAGILGGISVIIIIWAGTKYTLSGGDPAKTAEAKNQIMYAAIGIAVAISATAILNFVTGEL
jgi:multisubunit Na+/H+ antiporter MnhB subunit